MDELNDQVEMIADPDGRALVLSEMAIAAHRRRDVDSQTLSEMLELAEAARRIWGNVEQEEGYLLGIFVCERDRDWK